MAKWFYLIDDQSAGPIEPAALKQLATTGRLKPTDKVRREDLAEWYEAKQVKGLFAVEQSRSGASPTSVIATATQTTVRGAAQLSGNGNGDGRTPPTADHTATSARSQYETADARSVSGDKSFRAWYRTRLGQTPLVVQIILWLVYGFIWIPIWWVVSRDRDISVSRPDKQRTFTAEKANGLDDSEAKPYGESADTESAMTSYISADDYRMPSENRALWIGVAAFAVAGTFMSVLGAYMALQFGQVMAIPILLFPFIVIGLAFSLWTQQASLIGSCVAVSEQQFPEIYKGAECAAKRLHMKQPEVYVMHSPELNAYATGFLGRKSVVLHSAIVEAMNDDELAFIIGHEFSHIKCGHTNLVVLTGSAGRINLGILSKLTGAAFRFHSRQSEYTCDRGGLLACRNAAAAASALSKLSVGPELYKRMDMNKFLEQQMDLDQNDVARLSESLSNHPYTVRRVRAVAKFHDSSLYRKLASMTA